MGNVADLEIGQIDGLGQKITCLYAKKPPKYGVYGAERRVMVQYADSSEADLEGCQRKSLSQIAPIRGEIDGLIDGWRQGASRSLLGLKRSRSLKSKADRYNRRTADALVVALEGDVPDASTILSEIKQEILDDRVAHARFEYLMAAMVTAVALMFGAWLISSTYALVNDGDLPQRTSAVGAVVLLLAILACAGLFYTRWLGSAEGEERSSGKTGCETRQPPGAPAAKGTVEPGAPKTPDAKFWSSFWPSIFLFGVIVIPVYAMLLSPILTKAGSGIYLSDYSWGITLWRAAAAGSIGAFFSIAIGIRSRTVLPDLLQTSNLMDAALRISIGFIGAGVFEALLLQKLVTLSFDSVRLNDGDLVGVLLAGFIAGFSERLVPDLLAKANSQTTTPTRPLTQASGSAIAGGTTAGAAQAQTPRPATQAGVDDASDPVPDQANEDGCASDHALSDDDATRDDDLPPASGGVAAPAEEKAA